MSASPSARTRRALALLESAGKPQSVLDVADAYGWSRQAACEALKKLARTGRAKRVAHGVYALLEHPAPAMPDRRRLVDWDVQPLGQISDISLAALLGVTRFCVFLQRKKRGLRSNRRRLIDQNGRVFQ